ncbi:MAG: GtrA family protein, partial [Henriciella sp.]|nr:GtrA family protein [Henriciella sp.]
MALSPALLKRLGRFGVVGGLGFVVDAGLTVTLIQAGLDPFSARLIAIALAMLVTWRLNRAVTFGSSDTSQKTEGLRYSAVAVSAAAIN